MPMAAALDALFAGSSDHMCGLALQDVARLATPDPTADSLAVNRWMNRRTRQPTAGEIFDKAEKVEGRKRDWARLHYPTFQRAKRAVEVRQTLTSATARLRLCAYIDANPSRLVAIDPRVNAIVVVFVVQPVRALAHFSLGASIGAQFIGRGGRPLMLWT
jgi:hypothetical protein